METKDEEEEVPPEESDWEADLEEAHDYHARIPTPMRWSWQPPKVLMFESMKHPAGWLYPLSQTA